jgi:cyclase
MLKKRMIFTLLYDNGSFMLSRNFRLQKVGNLRWLQKNYNFSSIAFSIDELIVLDVTRGERDPNAFCEHLKALTEGCFVPIAAGGGVRSIDHAKQLLRSGADKVVINTPLYEDQQLVSELASAFGQQCLVASIDATKYNGEYQIWSDSGKKLVPGALGELLKKVSQLPVGELYLNSMDQDGTGQGYDFGMLEHLPGSFSIPVILAGGAGKFQHLAEGLIDSRVDAVATAHLFNFVGDGLKKARQGLMKDKFRLAEWPNENEILTLSNI